MWNCEAPGPDSCQEEAALTLTGAGGFCLSGGRFRISQKEGAMPIILLRSGKERRENRMPRIPTSVRDREVVFGAGYAAAVWCATRRAKGMAPPIVFEPNLATGGMFAQLVSFKLNSQGHASIASIASPGPSRIVPFSDIDDLNWIPNSDHQVSQYGAFEYPNSYDMCKAIARTLKEYGEVYTGVKGLTFSRSGQIRMEDGTILGTAKRIIWAAGTVPRNDYIGGPAVMSGYQFMKTPPPELHDRRIAVIGSGDTAASASSTWSGRVLLPRPRHRAKSTGTGVCRCRSASLSGPTRTMPGSRAWPGISPSR